MDTPPPTSRSRHFPHKSTRSAFVSLSDQVMVYYWIIKYICHFHFAWLTVMVFRCLFSPECTVIAVLSVTVMMSESNLKCFYYWMISWAALRKCRLGSTIHMPWLNVGCLLAFLMFSNFELNCLRVLNFSYFFHNYVGDLHRRPKS